MMSKPLSGFTLNETSLIVEAVKTATDAAHKAAVATRGNLTMSGADKEEHATRANSHVSVLDKLKRLTD